MIVSAEWEDSLKGSKRDGWAFKNDLSVNRSSNIIILNLGFPKSRPWDKDLVQVVYLRVVSRRQKWGDRGVDRKGQKANKDTFMDGLPLWATGAESQWDPLRNYVENGLEKSHKRTKKLGYLATSFHHCFVEGHLWGHWLAYVLTCPCQWPDNAFRHKCRQPSMCKATVSRWPQIGAEKAWWGWGGRTPIASATVSKTQSKMMPHIWTIRVFWIHTNGPQVTIDFIL